MMFGEKKEEYDSVSRANLPVFQMPKYITGREAAVKLLKEKDYITEADFWILMNRTKAGDKMLYSGLIISHNGCLKINDNLPDEQKFRPECVSVNESGYGGALVFTYICPEQGIYEVGEVSQKNCKNDYPYAMALKRCFDRVVLKQCKLAYYGVYSDSEADEFKENPPSPSKEEIQADSKKADKINDKFAPEKIEKASKDQVKGIQEACFAMGYEEAKILKAFHVESLSDLTPIAAENILKKMNERANAV